MVSLKREVSNGKIALELVLKVLPTLQVEMQVVTKIKDMAGNNLLSMHSYIHRQTLASKKRHLSLMKSSQSLKIINYIKTVL